MITVTRGDLFSFAISIKDSDGNIITVTDVKCQIRDTAYRLISDTTINEDNGVYTIQVNDTSSWPIEQLIYNVRYKINGVPKSTDNLQIEVIEGATQYE